MAKAQYEGEFVYEIIPLSDGTFEVTRLVRNNFPGMASLDLSVQPVVTTAEVWIKDIPSLFEDATDAADED